MRALGVRERLLGGAREAISTWRSGAYRERSTLQALALALALARVWDSHCPAASARLPPKGAAVLQAQAPQGAWIRGRFSWQLFQLDLPDFRK